MSDPAVPRRPTLDLRSFTPARVALGRSGASVPTRALLDFTLDHARARDAVHAVLDVPHLVADLDALGLAVTEARSQAVDRRDYLRRPDLGRQLDAGSVEALARIASRPCQLAIVIGDGLSAAAVHAHAVALVTRLLPLLAADAGVALGHVVVASGARVALGDEIGEILGAEMVVMLIGERPGLSSPDSLGIYLTYRPRVGRSDAERNCISNVRPGGLDFQTAAFKLHYLMENARRLQLTGVDLKDDSDTLLLGGEIPRTIEPGA